MGEATPLALWIRVLRILAILFCLFLIFGWRMERKMIFVPSAPWDAPLPDEAKGVLTESVTIGPSCLPTDGNCNEGNSFY